MNWQKQIRSALSVVLVLMTVQTHARYTLSEQAEISIVTLGPYQGEVWSAFGHSAIHVEDPENDINWFYNYGVYNFEQENFFLNFAKGLLKYRLAVGYYEQNIAYYEKQNRSVVEQWLNLTQAEKQRYFDYLQHNAHPDNAQYLYNYVYDNCATKIADVTDAVLPNQITYDYSFVEKDRTVRNLMDEYLDYQPWGDWAIDLGLGMEIDQEAPERIYLFLPDYVFYAFEGATLERNGQQVPLVKKTKTIFEPQPENHSRGWFTPLTVFSVFLLLVIGLTYRDIKRKKRSRGLDFVLFFLVGFIGLWLALLWWGTAHLSQNNLNILWALPTHFVAVFLLLWKRFNPLLRRYFQLIALVNVLLLIGWAFLPQPLGLPLIPLVLALTIRAWHMSRHLAANPS